jgi:GNAT superfamily N-acetyltransferase
MSAPPAEIVRIVYRDRNANVYSGPAFRFPRSPAEVPLPPGVVLRECRPAMAAALAAEFPSPAGAFARRQPAVAAWDGDRPVSVCYAARAADVAYEAGVDTLPAYRGRRLAPAVVGAWARLVRERGAIPLYSTSWDNTSSLAVARTLGLVRYARTAAFYH